MQKKTKFRSPLLDFFVVVLCLSLSAYFIWLFWKDLNSTTTRTDKDQIATISFKHNVAQRKFSDRIVWERLEQNSPLYNEDIIRTVDFAQATITFIDGTTLDVFENSMLQISYSEDGGVILSVDGGDIQVAASETAKNVAIQLSDGSEVKMDAGATIAAKSDNTSGVQNIEVTGGTAKVSTETGEVQTVAFGESVNIEKGKEIQKNPVTVISPAKEIRLLNLEGKSIPVTFEWRVNGSSDETVIVQTSRKKDFSSLESDEHIRGSSSIQLPMDDGVLYWRVYTEDTKDKSSQGRISVDRIEPIAALSPSENTTVRYRTIIPRLSFRWSGNTYANHYRLIVSSTADMSTPVASINTEDTFAEIDTLEEGNYWWTVAPYYTVSNIGYAKATEAKPFSIVKNSLISAPELSVPVDKAELTYKDTLTANFMWKSEIPSTFELQIAKDASFTETVFKTQTSATRVSQDLKVAGLSDGKWYWRIIRHSDDKEDINNESLVRSFTVAHFVPKASELLWPEDGFSAEKDRVSLTSFMWKLSDDAVDNGAVFQVSKDSDFATIELERKTSAMQESGVSLEAGTYYWRVGTQGENGQIENPTKARSLSVLRSLSKPVFTSPNSGDDLVAYGSSSVTVSWGKVEGADYYTLKIFPKSSKDAKPEASAITSIPSLEETSASVSLKEGWYLCRVQAAAIQAGGTSVRTGEAAEISFHLRTPERVEALSPLPDAHIAGLSALRNLTVFRWKSGRDQAKSYTFVLEKLQPNGTYKEVERKAQGTKTSVSLSRLTSGNYRYQILANTSDGTAINSEAVPFTIDAVPALERSVLTTPANGQIIGPAYLRSHRTIQFAWKEVRDATSYDFALYRQNADGSLKIVHSVKGTKQLSVSLSDLSVLDVGTFIWNVTAYRHAKDGFEEQKSPVSSAQFKIDFSIPDEVESIKPGAMYAQ